MTFSRRYWPIVVVPLAVGGALLGRYYLQRSAPIDADEAGNYSKVEDGLYVGGRVPEPPVGTRAVLCLSFNRDPYSVEASAWQPIADDGPAPSMEWLRKQVMFVDSQRKAGLQTYVHCDAGVSRGPMVTTAYLMYEHHWTRDLALEFLRQQRPIAGPNKYFMALLSAWEAELKKGASKG